MTIIRETLQYKLGPFSAAAHVLVTFPVSLLPIILIRLCQTHNSICIIIPTHSFPNHLFNLGSSRVRGCGASQLWLCKSFLKYLSLRQYCYALCPRAIDWYNYGSVLGAFEYG